MHEDFCLQSFQSQIVDMIGAYFKKNPQKLLNTHQREKILESLSNYFKNQELSGHLMQFDFATKPIRSLQSLCYPYHSDFEGQSSSPDLSQNADMLNAEHDKASMIQLSEQYQNGMFLHHYEDSFKLGNPNEENNGSSANLNNTLIEMEEDHKLENNGVRTRKRLKKAIKAQINQKKAQMKENMNSDYEVERQFFQSQSQHLNNLQSQTYEHLAPKKRNRRRNKKNPKQNSGILKLQDASHSIIIQTKDDRNNHSKTPLKPKGRKPIFPEMETVLSFWIKQLCKRNIRVTQADIRKKALDIMKKCDGFNESDFCASKGWMQKFFRRHREVCQMLSAEKRKSQSYDEIYLKEDFNQ